MPEGSDVECSQLGAVKQDRHGTSQSCRIRGNGIADRALGLGPHLMLGLLAGLVCKTAKTNTR